MGPLLFWSEAVGSNGTAAGGEYRGGKVTRKRVIMTSRNELEEIFKT
jgi:hypothetical protein